MAKGSYFPHLLKRLFSLINIQCPIVKAQLFFFKDKMKPQIRFISQKQLQDRLFIYAYTKNN